MESLNNHLHLRSLRNVIRRRGAQGEIIASVGVIGTDGLQGLSILVVRSGKL